MSKIKLKEYSDKHIEDLDYNLSDKINQLIEFFNEYGINYDNFTDLDVKKAYPNNDYYMMVPGQYNLEKWISSLRDISVLEHRGMSKTDSINKVLGYWEDKERFNFLNWVKFYEEGNHLKYKKAQVNLNGLPHYLLDLNPKNEKEKPQDNIISKTEKKQIIEKQRNKIISRLDSAEKLLRSEDGNLFAGDELELLIGAIYDLKKKIQLINKVSLNSNLYEDMIIRQSNTLRHNGFIKSAELLSKLAQDVNEQYIESIQPTTPALNPPPAMSPQTGGLPNTEPYSAPIEEQNSNLSPGITDFLENLETGSFTPKDELDDVKEIIDEQNVDDILIVEAQAVPDLEQALTPKEERSKTPTPKPIQKSQQPKVENNKLNISEKDIKESPTNDLGSQDSHIDTMLNSLFKNVTVNDAVKKLEDLSKIFNAREIPRQLALVDMMLNSLGLAQYFPSLSEATEKALDAHNYISTRIDDILSKLKNTTIVNNISLTDHNSGLSNQDTSGIQNKLESDEQAEELRKQRRKEKENKKLENEFKVEPEIDLSKELNKSTQNPVEPKPIQVQPQQKPQPFPPKA